MNVNRLIKSLFFSTLVYRIKKESDIDDFVKLVWDFWGMKSYFAAFDNGAQLCGVAVDTNDPFGKVLYQIERGTSGFSPLSNMDSWYHDLMVRTGPDGQHDGFQEYGNRAFNTWKEFVENTRTTVICGHSQGAGVGQRLAWLCCKMKEQKRLNGLKKVEFYGDAVPPAGKQYFADEMQGWIDVGLLEAYRFQNKDDPIASPVLREKFGGVDIGIEVVLPEMILQDLGLIKLLNHSCRTYVTAKMQWLLKPTVELSRPITFEDMVILNKIFWLTKN